MLSGCSYPDTLSAGEDGKLSKSAKKGKKGPRGAKKQKKLEDFDLGQQIALLGRGDAIGETCLVLQEPAPASVWVAEDTQILEVSS